MSPLLVVSVTHRTAPFSILEQVALDRRACDEVERELVAFASGTDEAVVLSTCNRIELYMSGSAPDPNVAIATLASHSSADRDELRACATVYADQAASMHLFRVAAGADSRIVGEDQIVGQVRAAITRALSAGTAGGELTGLFGRAASAARRVRRSRLGEDAPSLARAAVDTVGLASTIVVGAGAMATAITAELSARRIDHWVCARRRDRATRLTTESRALTLGALGKVLDHADALICATSARAPIVHRSDIETVMERRAGRPLTVVDLSMPRNVEPSIATIPGVRLVDLTGFTTEPDDLQTGRLETAVASEHARYEAWLAGRAAGALIGDVRERFVQVCRGEARRIGAAAGLDDGAIERLAHAIAGKLLHTPTLALKDLAVRGDDAGMHALAVALGLPTPPADREPRAVPLHAAS